MSSTAALAHENPQAFYEELVAGLHRNRATPQFLQRQPTLLPSFSETPTPTAALSRNNSFLSVQTSDRNSNAALQFLQRQPTLPSFSETPTPTAVSRNNTFLSIAEPGRDFTANANGSLTPRMHGLQQLANINIGRDTWKYRDPVQSFVSTSEASFYPLPGNAIGHPAARQSQLSRQDTELFEDTPASTYTEENENVSYTSFLESLTVKSLYKRIPEGRLFPDIRPNGHSANTTAPQVKWESKWEQGTMPLLECCDCSAHTSTMSMVPGDARYHFSEDDPSLNFEIDSAMGYKGVCMLEAFYQWEIQDKDEEIPLSGHPDFLTIEMPLPGPVKVWDDPAEWEYFKCVYRIPISRERRPTKEMLAHFMAHVYILLYVADRSREYLDRSRLLGFRKIGENVWGMIYELDPSFQQILSV